MRKIVSLLIVIVTVFLSIVMLPQSVSAEETVSIESGRIYNIKSVNSGKYLDVRNAGTADGTNVYQYTYNINAACQEWKIILVSTGSTPALNEYKIMDVNSGSLLSITASSSASQANAWIWHDDGTTGQIFRIRDNGDGTVSFLSKCSNFTKVLDIALGSDNGMGNCDNLQQYTDNNTDNQKFCLELCSRNRIPEGKYFFRNASTGKYAAMDDQNASNIQTFQWELTTSSSEHWELYYVGKGYYKIICANSGTNSGKVMGVENNSPDQDARVKLYNYSATASGMKWKFESVGNDRWKIIPQSGESNNRVLCKGDWIISDLDGVELQQRTYLSNSDLIDEWYVLSIDVASDRTPSCRQKTSHWCWVTSAQMMVRTNFPSGSNYGSQGTILREQREAVYHVFGDPSISQSAYDWDTDPQNLNTHAGIYTSVGDAAAFLTELSACSSVYSAYPSPYDEKTVLKFLLDGKPLCMLTGSAITETPITSEDSFIDVLGNLLASEFSGHVVVIAGCEWDEENDRYLYTICDPANDSERRQLTYSQLIFNLSTTYSGKYKYTVWFPTVVTKTSYSGKTLLEEILGQDYEAVAETNS